MSGSEGYTPEQKEILFLTSEALDKQAEALTRLDAAGIALPLADAVNHPAHYTAYKGIEVIQLTEQMNFCRGNAVKYIARAGLKDLTKEIEDLEKAAWYIQREIQRLKSL